MLNMLLKTGPLPHDVELSFNGENFLASAHVRKMDITLEPRKLTHVTLHIYPDIMEVRGPVATQLLQHGGFIEKIPPSQVDVVEAYEAACRETRADMPLHNLLYNFYLKLRDRPRVK